MQQITWPAGIMTISMPEYLALDALSSSACHTLLSRSPAHACYDREHPHTSTMMDVGTVAHQVLLEGSEVNISVVEANDWRTKAAREAREIARLEHKTPILTSMMDEVRCMVEAAWHYIRRSDIAEVMKHGAPERTLIWQEDDLWCKARPDWLTHDWRTIIHYKTTGRSANPEAFASHMVDMGYDLAAAFYAQGLAAVSTVHAFDVKSVFLLQETEPPYACSLVGLSPGLMELGMLKAERAIKVWRQCLLSGDWPAYPTEVCYAEPKPWHMNQMADNALAWHDTELYERVIEIRGGLT